MRQRDDYRARNAVVARAAKAEKAPSLSDRFWSKVSARGPDECWPWMAGTRRKDEGYGAFHMNGKLRPAQRVAFFLATGRDPEKMFVCHTCDNPRCCNPRHLFLGTNQDNINDKIAKGRAPTGDRGGGAKLTREAVISLRKEAEGRRRHDRQALAAKYGIAPSTVAKIVQRVTWRDV